MLPTSSAGTPTHPLDARAALQSAQSPPSPTESKARPGDAKGSGAMDGVAARQPLLGEASRKRKREESDDPACVLPAESGHEKRRLVDRLTSAPPSSPAALEEESGEEADEVGATNLALDDPEPPLPTHGQTVVVTDGKGREVTARYADIDQDTHGADPQSRLMLAHAGDGIGAVFTDTIANSAVVVFTAPGHVGVLHTRTPDPALRAEAIQERARFALAAGAQAVDTHLVYSHRHTSEVFDEDAPLQSARQLAASHGLTGKVPVQHRGSEAAAKHWIRTHLQASRNQAMQEAGVALQARSVVHAPWAAVLVRCSDGSLDMFSGDEQEPTVEVAVEPAAGESAASPSSPS